MDEVIHSVIEAEKAVAQRKAELQAQYPDVFKALEQVEDVEKQIANKKTEIKDKLIEAQDFDTHTVDGVNVSVSRVVGCDVEDETQVPEEYKSFKTVVDLATIKNTIKATGIIPAGIKDKTTFRFNWKAVKNV